MNREELNIYIAYYENTTAKAVSIISNKKIFFLSFSNINHY